MVTRRAAQSEPQLPPPGGKEIDWFFGTSKTPVTDERSFLVRVCEFVNGDTQPPESIRNLEEIRNPATRGDATQRFNAEIGYDVSADFWEEILSDRVDEINESRKRLGSILELAMRDPESLRARELREHVKAIDIDDLRLEPKLRITRAGVTLDYRLRFERVSAAVAYAVILLIDPRRSFWRQVCRCQLKSCNRFFMERRQETGRPQRRYCSREHMLEAHALRSTERAQRSRAKKKARTRKPK